MASLWISPGTGWPYRDFDIIVQLYQVGARFKALDKGVLTVPSDSPCIFFAFLTLLQ